MTSLPDATPCRLQSAAAQESMAGTAPHAVGWLALEQPGPWGRKALTESRLDPGVGARIEAACAAVDVRPALVRRPGRAGAAPGAPQTLLAAHTRPGATWLLVAAVADPDVVPWEDLAKAVALGEADDVRRMLPDAAPSPPHLLVCANGRRDVCCAVVGRPVAAEVARHAPERVWEATHLGGHRFAPTAAVLPSGVLHGRLDTAAALDVLSAADRGEVVTETARGRSTWSGPGQAAELAVRQALGERSADALWVEPTDTDDGWLVRRVGGGAWRVSVVERTSEVSRSESCSKDAVPMCSWQAGEPQPVA